MLERQIGILSYPVESEESQAQTRELQIKDTIDLIDNERQELMYRSLSMSTGSSPKRDKFFESRKYSGLNLLQRMDSDANMRSITSHEVLIENDEEEELNFQTQTHLVGSRAKQQFWDLYKSERKFKDFDPEI